jgi:Domain of unknown function (DUF1771)
MTAWILQGRTGSDMLCKKHICSSQAQQNKAELCSNLVWIPLQLLEYLFKQELRGPAEAVWEERRKAMDAAATAYRKGRTAQAKELLRRAAALQELAKQKQSEASKAMFRAK